MMNKNHQAHHNGNENLFSRIFYIPCQSEIANQFYNKSGSKNY